MSIIIKPISELLDYEFVIPKYQRGYRWDSNQITDLLNDLTEFQKNASTNDFYCLQPIAVVADKSNDKRFIVVDGQQRLTTIFLILKAFGGMSEKCYTLTMDERKEQEKYIAEQKFTVNDDSYTDNIDNFYVKKAYESILSWKEETPENSNASRFLTTLFSPGPIKGYAAVIWHIIEEDDAMEAFRRLNYGKIPLTSAELVKAIILQTDCYPVKDKERELQTAISQRRALEWDEMEHRLANSLFSSMVCRKDDNEEIGIGLVLDFVADKINASLKNRIVRNKDDKKEDLFVYRVVDAKIKESLKAKINMQEVISEIWGEIQDTFNLFADWYENRERYHLIGLWRLLSTKKSREFIKDVNAEMYADNHRKSLRSKTEFVNALRRQIKTFIEVPVAKSEGGEVLPASEQGLNSPDLRYDTNRKRIINILTAFNVLTVHEEPSESARFPFHLFQQYKTISLDHIHPQNISEGIKWEDALTWLNDRESDSKEADDTVWKNVAKSFGWREPGDSTEDAIDESLDRAVEEARQKVGNSIIQLKRLLADEDTFKENHTEAFVHIGVLDKLFGDMAGIDEDELHSIRNMALVSKDLNSALGNSYLDRKREIALEYDSKPKTDKRATFVPPATHKVYSKEYSAASPGNMKFWQPEDRRRYQEALQKVYDYFTK